MKKYKTEIVVVGAGLAGMVTALELSRQNKNVILLDSQGPEVMGGLANWAFGGMALVNTPEQHSKSIADSAEKAFADWCRYGELTDQDVLPRAWAAHYVERCIPEIYEYVKQLGVRFIPTVNWAERGDQIIGNSVPRYHILWGTSKRLVDVLKAQINQQPTGKIECHFNSKVIDLTMTGQRIVGCETTEATYQADAVVIATGGFGGNLDAVTRNWPASWRPLSQSMWNGCDPSNDGELVFTAEKQGARLGDMSNMWNYAAGIAHPSPRFEQHGLSLIPCRSALWLTPEGERIMPPMIGGFDTMELCHQTNELGIPYSWQILNRRIALKEFAISGSEHNPSIRDRKVLSFLKEILLGNSALVDGMIRDSDDFIVADTVDELVIRMQQSSADTALNADTFKAVIEEYDQRLKNCDTNDLQIARLLEVRHYLADKLRTAKPDSLLEKPPLIAIRVKLISRKSMGGLVTNLESQVLGHNDIPIEGLYAVGEAAGFGGGGASGKRSLEGTFLSGCILTARQAVRSLV